MEKNIQGSTNKKDYNEKGINTLKKIIMVVLAVSFVFGLGGFGAFAEETPETNVPVLYIQEWEWNNAYATSLTELITDLFDAGMLNSRKDWEINEEESVLILHLKYDARIDLISSEAGFLVPMYFELQNGKIIQSNQLSDFIIGWFEYEI